MNKLDDRAINKGSTPVMNFDLINNGNQLIDTISFYIKIDEAPDRDQYFFANQFFFSGGSGGYIGLQPTDIQGPNGESLLLVLFSCFVEGAPFEPVFRNLCHSGADGDSAGVTCNKLLMPFHRGDVYELTIRANFGELTGIVKNMRTSEANLIGQWNVPHETG